MKRFTLWNAARASTQAAAMLVPLLLGGPLSALPTPTANSQKNLDAYVEALGPTIERGCTAAADRDFDGLYDGLGGDACLARSLANPAFRPFVREETVTHCRETLRRRAGAQESGPIQYTPGPDEFKADFDDAVDAARLALCAPPGGR